MALTGQDGSYSNLEDVWPGGDGYDMHDGPPDELPQPIYLSRRALQSQIANLGATSVGYLSGGDDDSSGDEDHDDNYELIAPPLESYVV